MNQVAADHGTVVRLGHYQLRKSLGEGGYGRVYEAWDLTLQRRVAIKRLKAMSPQGQGSLITEARQAAALEHKAFVKIYTFEDDGQSQSIVMELVRGNSLHDYLPSVAKRQGKVLDIGAQVAAAMAEAHAAGMVHGDLKPANLMLEADGTVRILDFGLARRTDPLATLSLTSAAQQQLGTVAYMAPERLTGAPLQPSSDIYALGVILYELATGERPLPSLHGLALAAGLLHTDPAHWPFPPSTDLGVMALIRAMTAREPTSRLPSMAAINQYISGLRRGAAPELPVTPRAPRRWHWAAAMVLAAGAGLGALAAIRARALAPDKQAGAGARLKIRRR